MRLGIALGHGQALRCATEFEPLPGDFRSQRHTHCIEVGTGSTQVGSACTIRAAHTAEQVQFPTCIEAGLINDALASIDAQRWCIYQRGLLGGTPGTGPYRRQVIKSLLMPQPLRFAQTSERQAEIAVLPPRGADEFWQYRIAKR